MRRSAGSGGQDWIVLVAGAAGVLWRWRLELVLLALPAIAVRLLVRPLGGPLAIGIVVVVLGGLLIVPRAPHALRRVLRAAQVRRGERGLTAGCFRCAPGG